MAKLKFEGMDAYISKIAALANSTDFVTKPAVYDGASVLHKAIKSEIQQLPTDEVWRYPSPTYPAPKGIKEAQKQGLLEGLGFTKMESKNGVVNVKVGFGGYNNLSTERFPGGEPNALVARELVKGTSRIPRNNFVKKGANNAKQQAKAAMIKTAEAQINKAMKG